MTPEELQRELGRLPWKIEEVFVECPETSYSWSIRGISLVGNVAVIGIGECNGPAAPDDDTNI